MHHGKLLEKKIQQSGKKKVQVYKALGFHRSTLDNYLKEPELPKKKLQPILDYLKVDYADFFSGQELNEEESPYSLNAKIDALEKEIEYLKQQVADRDKIIELLKRKK